MHRQRPRLKGGVDIQLESAFSDGNWPLVVTLAEKRHRSLKDDYYDILKVCGQSQLDDPASKFAAVNAVQTYLKDGTVVKSDGVDLLEWATLDVTEEDDFLTTIGPLRVRAVKADPKNKYVGARNLESCLVHWDLHSAQQISAILCRSFPDERRYTFWNIAVTHLFSTSSQAPVDKRKLYGTLAQRQIERIAQAVEQEKSKSDDPSSRPANSLSEEEVLLLYEVVTTHGSRADFEKLINSVVFSPQQQFSQGSKEVLFRAIRKLKREGNWKAVFDLCESSLSLTDESGEPNLLASDLAIWRDFITAAGFLKHVNKDASKTVRELLMKLVQTPKLRPIYKKNLIMARVLAAFELSIDDDDDSLDGEQPNSTRLRELVRYIGNQNEYQACFDDVKVFIEQLDRTGIRYLLNSCIPHLHDSSVDEQHSHRLRLLGYKLKFFILTCPGSYTAVPGDELRFTCASCEAETEFQSCQKCFTVILQRSLDLYEIIAVESPDLLTSSAMSTDLVILIASCCIKLASANPDLPCSSLPASGFRYIIRGLLILERQLAFSPKNSQILLLLLQLHLLVGSAPRTTYLFEELAIKRTVMDSLAPLFYDRLTTVAPALLSPSDDMGYQLVDMLASHYQVSLKLRMPRRLTDALESDTYSSVLDIPRYITSLRHSCTRVMSLVEEIRSERMLGCPTWELLSHERFIEVTDDTKLKTVIDYGSFPSWDSASRVPIYARLRLGPVPTDRRMHISLLAEAFHDVLGYKPPSIYKVSAAAASIPERTFVLESLSHISNSFSKFIPGTNVDFTASEFVYFELVSVLSTVILLSAEGGREPSDTEAVCQLFDAATAAIDTLHTHVPYDDGKKGIEQTMSLLPNLHAVGMYRDAADAADLASRWILDFNNIEKERDRSGQSNLPKDVVAKAKELQAASAAARKQGKSWIASLETAVKAVDFGSTFRNWVFSTEDDGGEEVFVERFGQFIEDDFVADQVTRMRENVKGWKQVKWE